MTLDDLPQVVDIDRSSFSLPWPERSFRFELTDNPASRCWVAETEDRVIGMAIFWMIVDEVHIATLAVHREVRRQGIGEALLLHGLKEATIEGALSAVLEVRAGNAAALAMYRKRGFVENGRRLRYYKDNNEDAILMFADLKSLAAGSV